MYGFALVDVYHLRLLPSSAKPKLKLNWAKLSLIVQ